MTTVLHRKRGEQFFTDLGAPLAGGLLYFYEAGTTDLQTTFTNAAGTVPNLNPLQLDGYGRLPEAVYFGDSGTYTAYKETLKTASGITIAPWPMDNIPSAVPAITPPAFASLQLPWQQVTSAQSPITLTVADLGKAYECNTTGGDIEFDLPPASSCTNRGFWFKKTAGNNRLIIDPNASEGIDGGLTLEARVYGTALNISSNGAIWYVMEGQLTGDSIKLLMPSLVELSTTQISSLDEVVVYDVDSIAVGDGFTKKVKVGNLPANLEFVSANEFVSGTTFVDIPLPQIERGFHTLEVDLYNILPSLDGASLYARFGTAVGVAIGASDYAWGVNQAGAGAADAADAQFLLAGAWGRIDGSEFGQLRLTLPRTDSLFQHTMMWHGFSQDAGGLVNGIVGGGHFQANIFPLLTLRLLWSGGNFAALGYVLRGYRNF